MKKVIIAILVGIIMALPAASANAMTNDKWERRVQYHINVVRTNHNLAPLRHGPCVDNRAERFKWHLSPWHFHHHSLYPLLERCNAAWAGEVLAYGQDSPRAMVRAWMNSPSHRAIILSSKPRRIGIGVRNTAAGKLAVVDVIRH